MIFQEDQLKHLEPSTRKLLIKIDRTDPFVDMYVNYAGYLHQILEELIAEDFFFFKNEKYWYYHKRYFTINQLLRNHLRKYTKKFAFSRD